MSEDPKVIYSRIPSRHSYQEVFDLQRHLQQKVIRAKLKGDVNRPGYLLLCEHKPVYTIGKSGKIEHLTVSEKSLKEQEIEFHRTNRGGDITYHGPGQITGYPILDMDQYFNDVHKYVRYLEEVIIRTIHHFGIAGTRVEGYTGVWIVDQKGRRKICAIGVHMSRWVTLHGFALNVATDLNYFQNIIPCGIVEKDTSVTSISREINKVVNIDNVVDILKNEMSQVFGFSYLQ